MAEIKLATTGQELVEFFANQNKAILAEFLKPAQAICKSGFSEDPHGQTTFVDHQEGVSHIYSPNEMNGWTI